MDKLLLLILSISFPSPVWAINSISIPGNYSELTQRNGQLMGLDEAGNYYALEMSAGELKSTIASKPSRPARPADILTDGLLATGAGHIHQAWLGGPTEHYEHGVMGDEIEASRLYAQSNNQQTAYIELPSSQVFEDRLVRLADLDGDGLEELIVIRSHVKTGAGIASYGLNNGQLALEAASDTIGLSHRWLNIIGINDFTGDDRLEIAAVITPHIGGTLVLFQQQGERLVPLMKQWGYSNHEYGSRELGMSAVLDLNNDGTADMAVPNENRRELILLTTRGNKFQTLARIKHKTSIKSGIYPVDIDRDAVRELVYLLKDGTLQIVDP